MNARLHEYSVEFGLEDTILSKLSGDMDETAFWALAASSGESLTPNCSPMFAIISGLIFLIMDVNICQNNIKLL